MRSTENRVRYALEDHFGPAHIAAAAATDDLYRDAVPGDRGLGDDTDRVELMSCILREFGLEIPRQAFMGPVTIADLVAYVDAAPREA